MEEQEKKWKEKEAELKKKDQVGFCFIISV